MCCVQHSVLYCCNLFHWSVRYRYVCWDCGVSNKPPQSSLLNYISTTLKNLWSFRFSVVNVSCVYNNAHMVKFHIVYWETSRKSVLQVRIDSQLDGGSSEVVNTHWEGSVTASASSITVILRHIHLEIWHFIKSYVLTFDTMEDWWCCVDVICNVNPCHSFCKILHDGDTEIVTFDYLWLCCWNAE